MKRKIWYMLWLSVFLLGSIWSIFYVHGLRFKTESNEFVPTGVIELSSHPEGALIFLNDALMGESFAVFRGHPLGRFHLRIEKSGFLPFETILDVKSDLITGLKRLFLLPADIQKYRTVWGYENTIYWDPQKRGFVVLLSDKKAMQVVDIVKNTVAIMEFSEKPDSVNFSLDGELEILFPTKSPMVRDVFAKRRFTSFESLTTESKLSPQRDKLVLFQGKNLLIKDLESQTTETVLSLPEEIVDTWWMRNSDDILILTNAEILFWNAKLQEKRQILTVDTVDTGIFFPDTEWLFYKNEKIWESINIGLW